MKWFDVKDGGMNQVPLGSLSVGQLHQTAAIADCLGRLIPQEGVDYDVHIMLRGKGDTHVSLQIIPLTDKGEFWKAYVSQMIRKYPPNPRYKAEMLPDVVEVPDEPAQQEEKETKKENKNEDEKDGDKQAG